MGHHSLSLLMRNTISGEIQNGDGCYFEFLILKHLWNALKYQLEVLGAH